MANVGWNHNLSAAVCLPHLHTMTKARNCLQVLFKNCSTLVFRRWVLESMKKTRHHLKKFPEWKERIKEQGEENWDYNRITVLLYSRRSDLLAVEGMFMLILVATSTVGTCFGGGVEAGAAAQVHLHWRWQSRVGALPMINGYEFTGLRWRVPMNTASRLTSKRVNLCHA